VGVGADPTTHNGPSNQPNSRTKLRLSPNAPSLDAEPSVLKTRSPSPAQLLAYCCRPVLGLQQSNRLAVGHLALEGVRVENHDSPSTERDKKELVGRKYYLVLIYVIVSLLFGSVVTHQRTHNEI
jgi:hypothetical protein